MRGIESGAEWYRIIDYPEVLLEYVLPISISLITDKYYSTLRNLIARRTFGRHVTKVTWKTIPSP